MDVMDVQVEPRSGRSGVSVRSAEGLGLYYVTLCVLVLQSYIPTSTWKAVTPSPLDI